MAIENPFDQKIKFKFRNYITKIKALQDHVLVRDMNFGGRQLSSGIMLLGDDGKSNGIRPRWCKIYAVGEHQTIVSPGQWILVEHGRWTRGVEINIDGEDFTLRRIDVDAMMLVSDHEPTADDIISTAVDGEAKQRIDWSQQ